MSIRYLHAPQATRERELKYDYPYVSVPPSRPVYQVVVTTKLSKTCLVLAVYEDEEVARQMLERQHRPNWPHYAFTLGIRPVSAKKLEDTVKSAPITP